MSAVTLPALPAALERAGCTLAVVGRQLAVQDRDGRELERVPRRQAEWLWLASTHALIERQAEALGLRHALHEHALRVRLWWPAQDAEAARRGQPGARQVGRWSAVWRWMTRQARRQSGDGEARGPPGEPAGWLIATGVNGAESITRSGV